METTKNRVITCKAAVCWGQRQPLVIEEIQVEPPNYMEVRIKIIQTSLCHSDLHNWKGIAGIPETYPRILGHEGVGIVESVGEGVADLKEGDHVIPLFMGECGECDLCKSPKTNYCNNFELDIGRSVMRRDGKTRFSVKGKPVYHCLTSTFSEYTVVEYACVAKISKDISFDRACMFACGLTTGVGAAIYTADVQPGSTVVVFGLGSVGLAVVEGARIRGASRIIGIDKNPTKFLKARQLGASDFLNPNDHEEPIHKVIWDITEGGVDYSFECIGNMELLYEAFLATKEAVGVAVMVGLDPTGRKFSLGLVDMLSGRRVLSTLYGGVKGKSQMPSLAANNEIRAEEFITHRLPITDINKAFDMLTEGTCLRCIFTF